MGEMVPTEVIWYFQISTLCLTLLWTLMERKMGKDEFTYHSGYHMKNNGILEFKRVSEFRIL